MILSRRCALALAISTSLVLAGCGSGDPASSGVAGTGGQPGSGGTAATGGRTGTGGGTATGGGNGTGGATATGGAAATGGNGTGGAAAAGGNGTGGVAGSLGSGGATGGTHGGTGGAAGVAGTAGHSGGSGAGQSGKAGAPGTGGQAGARGPGGQAGGAAGAGGMGPEAPGGRITGYGTVLIAANAKNQIVRVQTTMVVPPEPPATGTLFLWPGLDPDGANFDPINNGVLQPVLTWGPSCAPGKQPRDYSTWWISGQYVNTNGNVAGYTGCSGGPIMSVGVGDTLDMDIALSGTVWTQTVTDVQTNQSVSYSIDMMDQAQNLAYFVIEEYSAAPVSEVIFTDSKITFASSDAGDCKLYMRGQNDYVSVPVASSDGLTCTIAEIILRAEGIP